MTVWIAYDPAGGTAVLVTGSPAGWVIGARGAGFDDQNEAQEYADELIAQILRKSPVHFTLEFLQTEDGKAWKSRTAQKNS